MNLQERIISELLIDFNEKGLYSLQDEDIENLSVLLHTGTNIFFQAMNGHYTVPHRVGIDSYSTIFNDEEIIVDDGTYNLFDLICNCYFADNDLKDISLLVNECAASYESLNAFQDLVAHYTILNSSLATYKYMKDKIFSNDFVLYSDSEFDVRKLLGLYQTAIINADLFRNGFIQLLGKTMEYEFKTRISAIYIILILTILIYSNQTTDSIKRIACDIYSECITLFRNGRVIDVQSNYMYLDINQPYQDRTRNNSDTTRLEILYGFENYDAYELRLDMAHKGQELIHFNNETPGRVKCCLFTEKEFKDAIREFPDTKSFFIGYGRRYALKERKNCIFNDSSKKHYEELRSKKEHDPVANSDYSEQNLLDFIHLLTHFLPVECLRKIDKEGRRARDIFDYNKIMGGVTIIIDDFMLGNDKKIKDDIDSFIDMSLRLNLISKSEKKKMKDYRDILDFIDRAKDKIIK